MVRVKLLFVLVPIITTGTGRGGPAPHYVCLFTVLECPHTHKAAQITEVNTRPYLLTSLGGTPLSMIY